MTSVIDSVYYARPPVGLGRIYHFINTKTMLNKVFSLLVFFLFVQNITAQTEFIFVKSQPRHIADTIPSDQLGRTIDWGGDIKESITGQVVYAPQNINGERLLCDTPMVDFTNKIVLIDRGICNFSFKAFQAQKLGAVGVIIRNDVNLVLSMGGGEATKDSVSIPVIMIPYDVGIDMEEVLLEGDTVVVGFFPEQTSKIITFQKEVTLDIYPNPMKSFSLFELEGIEVKSGTLQLFDIGGRLVKEKSFFQNKFQITKGGLPSGNYFFKISLNQIPIAATGLLQVVE